MTALKPKRNITPTVSESTNLKIISRPHSISLEVQHKILLIFFSQVGQHLLCHCVQLSKKLQRCSVQGITGHCICKQAVILLDVVHLFASKLLSVYIAIGAHVQRSCKPMH